MRAVLAPPSLSRQPVQEKTVCCFVILYEDFLAVERAEAFCEKLRRKLDLDTHCRKEAWSFQSLHEFPNIARITAEEAAEDGDFIIVSLDGVEELPAHVKAWMEVWGKQVGDRRHALITLFNKFSIGKGACASTKAYLHRFTNRFRN